MKKSSFISLTILTTVCISCGESQDVLQNKYLSRDECVRHWDDDDCDFDGSSGVYRGPRYYRSGSNTYYYPRSGSNPLQYNKPHNISAPSAGMVKSSVSRGGFGSSSSFHSAGG
jgi:uncharacterized protein YgiB involved in biofilm formation